MAPPREFVHVEWKAARRFDLPNDRKYVERNFTDTALAASQVAHLLTWVPTHVELVGIWRCSSHDGARLGWTEITVAELLDHLRPGDRARVDTLAREGIRATEG